MRSSSWFNRSLACGALLALALPVVSNAQTARVEGMSLQGDFIKDYTGIYQYPSEIPNVGNLIYGELGRFAVGTPVDRGVGTVLGNLFDGRFGVWGLHLRQFTPAIGQGDAVSQPAPGFAGLDPNTNTNEAFDLMWGMKRGTTSYGLRLNRSFFKTEDAIPGVTTSVFKYDATAQDTANLGRNIMGIGGGIGFEMNPNTNVEVTFLYQTRDFETSVTPGAKTEDDGPTTYSAGARAMWQWQPNVLVIPMVRFYSYDLSTKTTPAGGGAAVVADNTLSGWQAGIAGNWTLGTNDLFVLGLNFAQNRLEQEADIFGISGRVVTTLGGAMGPDIHATEMLTPQLFAALETHVNNWLTLRLGANKGAFQSLEVEEQSGALRNVKVSLSSFHMNIGAGVKLGTLQLDAVVNDTFPQTLGGLFSQTPGYVAFPKVTATYSF